MTSRLDAMLQPGERVVYRELPGWNPRSFWPMALEGPVLAALLAFGFYRPDAVLDPFILFLMGLQVVIGIVYGLNQAFFKDDRSRESLITDRRVLQRATRDGRELVTDIPLAQVTAVDVIEVAEFSQSVWPFGPCVVIRRHNEQEKRFSDLRKAGDFAAALAQQKNLPRLNSMGRLEHLSFYCCLFGGANLAVLSIYLFMRFVEILADLPPYAELSLLLLAVASLSVPAVWLGAHLAVLLAVAFMPLFASAEQAGAWLRMRPKSRLAKWMLWKHPIYFKLVGLVYGRPFTPANDRAERHVR